MSSQAVVQSFVAAFGHQPTHLSVAPGRVNLIGEHTDYNDGFVFPAAISHRLYVAARVIDGPSRLRSMERGEGQLFDANQVKPTEVAGWSAYAAGMAWVLRSEGFEDLPNVEAMVRSEVPIGSGISSSAALEMAFGCLWNVLGGLAIDNRLMALYAQKCENRYVGVNCGIMDQMASAMGRQSHAMFLDTRSLEIAYAPISPELKIVICDTRKPRALTDSAYNERRSQCESAAREIGVPALRDATMGMLDARAEKLDSVTYRRAKHVITENLRCQRFVEALEDGDTASVGQLMKESHVSLRDDYEVSCRELDLMAEAAWGHPACIGARMTGAGFGGSCVALVSHNMVDDFITRVGLAYESSANAKPRFHACDAVDGACCQLIEP